MNYGCFTKIVDNNLTRHVVLPHVRMLYSVSVKHNGMLTFPSRPAFHILQHSCWMKSTWPLSGCCECCTLPSSLLIPRFPVPVLFLRAVPRSVQWRVTEKRQLCSHSLHLCYTDKGKAAYIHICALITNLYSVRKRNKTNGQTVELSSVQVPDLVQGLFHQSGVQKKKTI